jgi:Amt family ammonium transporter
MAIAWALIISTIVYAILKSTVGIRLTKDQELRGADLSIHRIGAYPERHIR